MSEMYGRVCEEGHIISMQDDFLVEIHHDLQGVKNPASHIHPDQTAIEGDNYCQKCGSKTIERCPNCDKSFIRLSANELSQFEVPDYCKGCGEAYPWVTTIEEKKAREGLYLDINLNNIGGQFYPKLINQINNCYQIKANEATRVLHRKLLECLLVDILRGHYGKEEMDVFYDKNNGRTHAFGTLISNFKSSEDDLSTYSNSLDDNLYQAIEKFKYHGDGSAHAIEPDVSDESIEEQSESATNVTKILFKMRENVFVANSR